MKNMSLLEAGQDLNPDAEFEVNPNHMMEETGFESFEWALEVLSAQFGIVVRDLDRFAAMPTDPDHLAWIDEAFAALATLELLLENEDGSDLEWEPDRIDSLVDMLLEESDWLLEQADFVSEEFGDFRLAIRLRGLSGACYDAVRCLPWNPEPVPFVDPEPTVSRSPALPQAA